MLPAYDLVGDIGQERCEGMHFLARMLALKHPPHHLHYTPH